MSASTFSEAEVEYIPGKWVESPYGPLLAFQDRLYAERFAKHNVASPCSVWRADCDGEPSPVDLLSNAYDPEAVAKFWEAVQSGVRLDLPTYLPPTGTVACPKIRLIERINS